jgi:hypothetical protein
MLISSKWMAAPLLVAASFLFTADAPTASAQHGIFRGGGLSISIGNRGYRPSYRSYSPLYRSNLGYGSQYGHRSHYGHGSYHDTSHYDYHPTEIRRHGNHYDVMPGHYDLHRTGHWHH